MNGVTSVERCAALTFDLDSLARDLYRPALGRDEARQLEDVSFERIVPRIADWLARIEVRATFFTIGDYARRYPSAIRDLARAGHEIASHTDTHPRDFSQLDYREVRREVVDAHKTLTEVCGIEPRGFRAPGFTTSPTLMRVLVEQGYAYDSSIVPSWTYTTLKHVYRSSGMASTGYLYPESYRAVLAPQTPYRVEATRRFTRHAEGLLEIPITTATPLQWPLIYGLHSRARGPVRQWIERSVLKRPFVLMVFHDLEFAVDDDLRGLPTGVLTRPHLMEPLDARLDRLEAWVTATRVSHRFKPLSEVAAAYIAPVPATSREVA